MYKVIELKGREITNYQGTIVSVLRNEYCYGMWYLTCLVQEDDSKIQPLSNSEIIKNYDEFKRIVTNYMKERNPMLEDCRGLIFNQTVNSKSNSYIFSCGFTCDCKTYVLTYNTSKWTLYNQWQTPISVEGSIDECLNYLWSRIREDK